MPLALPVMLGTLSAATFFPLSVFWTIVFVIPSLLGFAFYVIRQTLLREPSKIANSVAYALICGCSGFLALVIWLVLGQLLEALRFGLGILGQWVGPVIAGGIIGLLSLFCERRVNHRQHDE